MTSDKALEKALVGRLQALGIDHRKDGVFLISSDKCVGIIDAATASESEPAWALAHSAGLSASSDSLLLLSSRPPSLSITTFPRSALDAIVSRAAEALPAPLTDDGQILGRAPAILLVKEQIRSVARFRHVSVLILGETGSGKELVAQAIHRLTHSQERPFVAINCAAIPEHLFESELFGHESGAYTGARGTRIGLLEVAGDGTIFLDEVGDMPMSLQPKLLRALETREFRRVGSNRPIPLRARVVSATSRGVMAPSTLRLDLRFRLGGFTIGVPSLKEREEDIELLARHFLSCFVERERVPPLHLTSRAIARLRDHAWPGNVRELRAVVEHAAIISTGEDVTEREIEHALDRQPFALGSVEDAPSPSVVRADKPASSPAASAPASGSARTSGLREIERNLIVSAYAESGRNLSRASRVLGIPRSTLRAKLQRYGEL